jgi:hypothetical protein
MTAVNGNGDTHLDRGNHYIIAPGPAYVIGKLKSLRALETLYILCATRIPRTDRTRPISVRQIADQLHLSEPRWVPRYIRELIDIGLVECLERGRGPGAGSIYRVKGTDPGAGATVDTHVHGSQAAQAATVDTHVRGTVDSDVHGTVDTHVHNLREERNDRNKEATPVGVVARGRATTDTHQPNGALNGSSKGQRLPPDWTPTAADIERARRRGLKPDEEAEAFRDYWLAEVGPKAFKHDWNAAFRTWCRISGERAKNHGGARLTAAEERYHRGKEISFRAAMARS